MIDVLDPPLVRVMQCFSCISVAKRACMIFFYFEIKRTCMMGTDFAKEINKLEDPGAD